MRVAAYVRYSSDRQRQESTADQVAVLIRLAASHGWPTPEVYADPALSGTHTERPELQRLLRDCDAGQVEVLLIEDLSRLSRDLGETDRLVKRLAHQRVRILSANGFDSDSEWSRLQVGLEGIMNEAYIRDLAARTHRGQEGAVSRGHHAGGRSYGYRSEPVSGPGGTPVGWRLVIDPAQAAVVRRIFRRFADGASVYQIVRELNADGIPGPRSATWSRSALYPDQRAGVGILGNPLYRGELIWNRTRWERIPGTKRRRRVERPPHEWHRRTDPALAIIPPDLWEQAQAQIHRSGQRPGPRGSGILTGILRCGTCGARYIIVNQTRMGCAAHKERGPEVCPQAMTVHRRDTERAILDYVRQDLLSPAALEFYLQELARLQAEHQPDLGAIRRRLTEAEGRITNLVRAIEAGILTDSTRAALLAAESDRDRAQQDLADASRPPAAAQIDARVMHRRIVAALGDLEDKAQAREALSEILGEVEIVAMPSGPVARIDKGRTVAALVANSGSGGRIWPMPTYVTLPL